MNDIRCAACVDQLTSFQLGLVPETDETVVSEHLAGCPDCQVFADQLDQTVTLLSDLPLTAPPALVEGVRANLPRTADTPADLLDGLCRLADSLDPDNAQDLVQDVLVSVADQDPGAVSFDQLAGQLTDAALADGGPEQRFSDAFDTRAISDQLDPDADTAELFYGEFYSDGPDLGSFIDAPVVWGETIAPIPDADIETDELFGAVDDALGDLPAPLAQLVQLVDLEQVELSAAAKALRLSDADAVAALHRGRVHVRGAIDNYLR